MKEKNYGIELARVLSMMMIMCLHILNQGGIIESIPLMSFKGQLFLGIEYLCIVAVNIFGLITGYLMISSKSFKIRRIIDLWLQVVFFSCIITISIFSIYHISLLEVIKGLLPTIFKGYWYFSAYLVMYLFIPFLNEGIKKLDRQTLIRVIIAAFVLFSLISSLAPANSFYLEGGYSPIWLMYLYIVGAYIKLHGPTLINIKIMLLKYISFAIITLFVHDVINIGLGRASQDIIWIARRYSFPPVLLMSISLFLILIHLNINQKYFRKINFFSTSAFAAYLLQTNVLVFNYILLNSFVKYSKLNSLVLLIIVLVSSILTFIVGVLIDKIRLKIFEILKVQKILNNVSDRFSNIIK